MSDLTVRGLTARYSGDDVLRGVDLFLPAGSLGSVLGPSGCGKSTLLRVLSGLHRAHAGEVRIGDRVVDDGRTVVAPEERGIGLVPQSGALFPHLTVRANIGYGLRRRRLGRRAIRARVDELLDLTGLGDLDARMPHQLSGGQRQRVALARALAPTPAVVLLDEPFSALDAALRTTLRSEIRRILLATGTTTLLVTHDQGEALSFADQLAVMREGRIEQWDEPDQLYLTPSSPWVATFVGDANVLQGVSDGTRAQTPWGVIEHVPQAAGPVEVVVRPEQVDIRLDADAAPGVAAVVVDRDFHGHDALLLLRLDSDAQHGLAQTSLLRARVAGNAIPATGARVKVHVTGQTPAFPRQ